MKTIEANIVVDAEHRATLQLPEDVAPGSYRVVVWIEESTPAPLTFPAHDVQVNLPEDFRFRREQIHDDSGRGA